MGADLYIKSLTEPRNRKYCKLFEQTCAKRDSWDNDISAYRNIVTARKHILKSNPCNPVFKASVLTAKRQLKEAEDMQANLQKDVDRAYELAHGGPGYFRDSYNGMSIMTQLGLSWWRDVGGRFPSVTALTKLVKRVKAAKLPAITRETLIESGVKVDNDENSVMAWRKYFGNKKRRLVRFLERAIREKKKGSNVVFSL
jgi:hypothetical protein